MKWIIKMDVTLDLPRLTDKKKLQRYFENVGFVPMTDDIVDINVTKHSIENAKKVR